MEQVWAISLLRLRFVVLLCRVVQNLFAQVGLIEVMVHTIDGAKTIGRFNTISLEDAKEDILECLMKELLTYFSNSSLMDYPAFILKTTDEYNRLHDML